jgi:hypothetical protein
VQGDAEIAHLFVPPAGSSGGGHGAEVDEEEREREQRRGECRGSPILKSNLTNINHPLNTTIKTGITTELSSSS